MFNQRPATDAEIVEELHHQFYRYNWNQGKARVRFETWVYEALDRRTEHGVRHITRAKATVQFVNRIPHVQRHGRLERLYADVITCGEKSRPHTFLTYSIKEPKYRYPEGSPHAG